MPAGTAVILLPRTLGNIAIEENLPAFGQFEAALAGVVGSVRRGADALELAPENRSIDDRRDQTDDQRDAEHREKRDARICFIFDRNSLWSASGPEEKPPSWPFLPKKLCTQTGSFCGG